MQSAESTAGGPALAALQRWLQAVITHPAGIEAGIESDEARREVDISPAGVQSVISPSSRQSSLERLAIYGHAYYLRLLECLRELFPCLTEALGRETFDQFAAGYLQRHPPTSYTLQRLADRFVEFLTETQPAEGAPWAGFVIDLARLESAIDEVFDGPGLESDPWEADAARHSANAAGTTTRLWTADPPGPQTRLIPSPSLVLLELTWPASTYYTQWKLGEHPPWPAPQPQQVALSRRDYVVRRYELSPAAFALLARLRDGMPIGQAVSETAEEHPELTATQVHAWMSQWSAERFFASIAAG